MDYEKLYKEALQRAKDFENGEVHYAINKGENIMHWIFPELRESEDEKIRKELFDFLTYGIWQSPAIDKVKQSQRYVVWLSWLEKQAPVEHFELKRGHWYMCHRAYCCRADHLTVQEGERFECKEDGVVKGFAIKDPEKYFIEVHAPAPMEDDQNDEVRRRSTIQVLEYAKSLDAYNQYGKADIDKNIIWLEKQGEQKRINDTDEEIVEAVKDTSIFDMVEPKFKVGDWVTDGDRDTFQIIKIDNGWYYPDVGVRVCCDVVDDYYHLWTIQDAKDGDILQLGEVTVIFKEFIGINCKCYWSVYNGEFEIPSKDETYYCYNANPATKEQRALLFQKMKAAGYKWDAEKKELKKISQEYPLTPDECIEPAWSEEDERRFNSCLYILRPNSPWAYVDFLNVKWLKSLKDRVQPQTWKPSDEQMEVLENVRKILHTNEIYSKANHLLYNFEELIRTLNKLREE